MAKDFVENAIAFLSGEAMAPNYKMDEPCIQYFDKNVVESLSHRYFSGKAYSTKQAKLALRIITKYKSRLETAGFNVNKILEEEIFENQPIEVVTIKHPIICLEDDFEYTYRIDIAFPFKEELVAAIKEYNGKTPIAKYAWEEQKRTWSAPLSMKALTLVETLIQKDRNFYCSEEIATLLVAAAKAKSTVRKSSATIQDGKLLLENLFESQCDSIRSMLDGSV